MKALLRKAGWVAFPQQPLDVLIVSPGGSASSALIGHIGKFAATNNANDSDGLKHLLHPPAWLTGSRVKVIFVDRDTSRIVESLDRRGYVNEQLAKLACFRGLMTGQASARKLLVSAIERQRQNWAALADTHQVLTVNYESLWENPETIGSFLGLDNEQFLKSFPVFHRQISRSEKPVRDSQVKDLGSIRYAA